MVVIDPKVADYIAAIPAEHRPLFDRMHQLILEAVPAAEVALAYDMPTYRVGQRRLHVAAWKHGISVYGWKAEGDGGFTRRHPELKTSTGTIQLRVDQAAQISDQELRELARAALGATV